MIAKPRGDVGSNEFIQEARLRGPVRRVDGGGWKLISVERRDFWFKRKYFLKRHITSNQQRWDIARHNALNGLAFQREGTLYIDEA